MATIRKRGGKFQAIVRRGYHSQAKTFSKRADAEHWAKRLEIEIEREDAQCCPALCYPPANLDLIRYITSIQEFVL